MGWIQTALLGLWKRTAPTGEASTKFNANWDILEAAIARSRTLTPLAIAAGHVATNCATSLKFKVAVTGDFTLDLPTNALDGDIVVWDLVQTAPGGDMTLSPAFVIPALATPPALSNTLGHVDKLSAQWDAASGKWRVVAFLPDYPG